MLANNNVSAGRVITKMQFDIKAPVPRVLFSPAQAVPEDMKPTVLRQSKSPAAESAIKLTVFQADTPEETEAPASVDEPEKRESVKKVPAEPVEDVVNIVKKWTKKG
jgi:hypothetical protein